MKIKVFLRNPITTWISWVVKKIYLETKYRKKDFVLGYLSFVNSCTFGKHVRINEFVFLTQTSVGDYTYVAPRTILGNCKIGKFTSIGPDIRCGLGHHPTRGFVSTHPAFYSTAVFYNQSFVDKEYLKGYKETVIGNDVWIGTGVAIIDGVHIGDGAVVGAGAVVTKDVEPYSVVGGVPAKEIRKRFSDDQINFLIEFKWWDKDEEWLRKNFKKFHNIETLHEFILSQ